MKNKHENIELLPVLQFTETKVLHEVADPVTEEMFENGEVEKIVKEMSLALHNEPDGAAIAAPQIGYSWRIFVVRGDIMAGVDSEEPGAEDIPDVAFINPEFIEVSDEVQLQREACLSCRGFYVRINVPLRVKIRAQDINGNWFEAEGDDTKGTKFIAKIFRHEIAHLDGRTVITKGEAEHVYVFDPLVKGDDDEEGAWVKTHGRTYDDKKE